MQKYVLELFDLRAPTEDFIHGLEPQGSLGSKSCIKAKVFDQGPPKKGPFLRPQGTAFQKIA